jgi:hypothetical protein
MDLKSKAKVAFDHSKALNEVFVTSDGQVFLSKSYALDYANKQKLADKTITPFTRDQANDQPTFESEDTLIPKIKAAKTVEEIYQLVPSADTRQDVTDAARERAEEIRAFVSGQQPGII